MYKLLTILLLATLNLTFAPRVSAQTVLLMAEAPGCAYCAQWHAQIGPIYPKTGEGAAAPLRRIDINDPTPDDISLARAINFTPTFVLLIDGAEAMRIEGYPGEDFFWGLLGMMLEKHQIPYEKKQTEAQNAL